MSHLRVAFTLFSLCLSCVRGSPSVIIVGAGPAGIAAATKLLQNSITNITILEAEGRIGGRINSVRIGDGFVDVGAEYCHGKKNNIVYELVKDLDVLEPISEEFTPALYYSNGSRLDTNFTNELQAVILGYDSNIPDLNTTGLSIGELFIKKYNSTIIRQYGDDHEKLKILNAALRLAEKVSLMIDGAFSWLDTSPVKHYERSEGHQLLVWKGRGYKTILDVLTKAYPDAEDKLPIDDKIHLEQEVSKVIWNGSRVLVRTQNATFVADHVIFTPSVGVLKERSRELFIPELPEDKQNAIRAIGIGGVMKIIMLFDEEWWRSDDVIFTFLWSDDDLYSIVEQFPLGPVRNGISWVSSVALLAKVPGNPKVLIAWVTGEFVPEIEKLSEDILRQGCNYLLQKFLGGAYNISRPQRIIKSTWRSNPHFRGTYSYERAGFERQNVRYQVNLASPLSDPNGRPLVLFAGEASNPIHYSTVHGAIETGHREADRIINLYKQT